MTEDTRQATEETAEAVKKAPCMPVEAELSDRLCTVAEGLERMGAKVSGETVRLAVNRLEDMRRTLDTYKEGISYYIRDAREKTAQYGRLSRELAEECALRGALQNEVGRLKAELEERSKPKKQVKPGAYVSVDTMGGKAEGVVLGRVEDFAHENVSMDEADGWLIEIVKGLPYKTSWHDKSGTARPAWWFVRDDRIYETMEVLHD
jgi:uncharacterized small protein (DUF1192 family)